MSQSLAAFTPVKFAMETIKLLYNESLLPKITNTKYEGTLKASGDRVTVRTSHKITFSAYTKGMTLVNQELNPVSEDLLIDQAQYFSFAVDDIDKIQNDIDAISEYSANAKRDAAEMLDTDVLSYMRKNVLSAGVVGTAYATGTAAVAATTGVVTGSGTTWTAAMVGGIFTITGLTGSYLVTARNSNTEIVIKDLDGVAYTGGAVSATTYSIAGATHVAVTKSNIYEKIVALRTALSKAKAPMEGRFLVVNSVFEGALLQAPEFIPAVGSAYEDAVKGGMVGKIGGFDVYRSELVDGDNTTGYWFVAGTKEFCSFAAQLTETAIIPAAANPTTFTSICKGLWVWGRKVFAGTRAYGAVLRATIG